MLIKDQLTRDLEKLVEESKLSYFGKIEIQLEHPENPEHGDYSTNIAMIIFANLKIKNQRSKLQIKIQKYKNPLELAQEIAKTLNTSYLIPNTCSRIEAIAPGFINFWLSADYLSKELELALSEAKCYGGSDKGKGKTVVVEYSSPNIAKRFGVGHLRSTIIGQSIYNIYQLLGYKVIGDNHLGDWGTQFGAIIAEVKSAKLKVQSLAIDDLERLYVDFNEKAKGNPDLWEEARKWFKKLEDGDEDARKIWKACIKISFEEFDKIYKLLNVSFDNMHGESFYEDKMESVIAELKEKKLVVEDQGALIIKYPDSEFPPGIVLKSDGATTYLTRDLAQIKFRLGEWNPDLLIYEVGVEQTLHFRQLFRAIEMLGWARSTRPIRKSQDLRSSGQAKQDRFVHVKHGLYLNPEGKKFSTRRGDTVGIEAVLTEAVERARKLGNRPVGNRSVEDSLVPSAYSPSASSDEVATAVGIGAVKYFDLSHSPESNIIFSWEKMFLLTGNSGPYLQYTNARARSVLSKAMGNREWAVENKKLVPSAYSLVPEELALLRTLYKFPEVVESAAEQFSPNLICNYLFDLASKYNLMYNNLPILGNDLRLKLTRATANILKTGLDLLGINAPERM